MPEPKKRAPAKKSAKKMVAPMPMNNVQASMPSHMVCRSCNALPVGSVELTALMLVLVFSLSAVLCTSVYALQNRGAEVAALQEQVASLQAAE